VVQEQDQKLVIYLPTKLERLKKRLAKKKVPFEERISYKYLEAVVKAEEHLFFRYK
jgi:deoxyadenosine/deoxycytidine kinase